MLFERFEVPGLAHYSYAVGCAASGEIAIVDPKRDVDTYLRFAEERNLRITHVLETHIHADYASGARELAARTGARLGLSAHDEGELYEVIFPHEALRDGDAIEIGAVRLRAWHTPGHTPEHLSFLVYDTARSAEVPLALLSGDFLFVGSLGRPDLLGEEAKHDLAARLFESVQALQGLPDGLAIHPAHGAGSMCGAGMGGLPASTLGFERIANPYLDPRLSREAFVERILANVPPFPPYYRRMKQLNAIGADALDPLPGLEPLGAGAFHALRDQGHVVIDVRSPEAFGEAHIPGAFGIGEGPDLSTWAAWVVPYDTPLLVVADGPAAVESAVRSLVRVGLDDVRGHLGGGLAAWQAAGYPLRRTPQLSVHELHERLERGEPVRLIDVRTPEEWRAGHIEGAVSLLGGTLVERPDRIPQGDGPLALICASGYRSTVVASALERLGLEPVNVRGGLSAWQGARLPLVEGA